MNAAALRRLCSAHPVVVATRFVTPAATRFACVPVAGRLASTLKFTREHEYVKFENGVGTVGISDYAQNALGDVVYVDLPEKGRTFKQKDTVVAVESVKAASDVYAPVSGQVVEVNDALTSEPSLVNKSPLDKGWMFKLKLSNAKELDSLLDEKAYQAFVKSSAKDH